MSKDLLPPGLTKDGVQCDACQQFGLPVRLDDRGFLVQHPGRRFLCRVKAEVPWPAATDPRAVLLLYVEWSATRAGADTEAAYWEWYSTVAGTARPAPAAQDVFAHESTSMFRTLETAYR